MLRIYAVVLEVVREVRPMIEVIERRDRALADQVRRALASVPLNVAEGSGMNGGNRVQRYRSALGSMREVVAAFEVAEALGYLEPLGAELVARCNQIQGTLVRVIH